MILALDAAASTRNACGVAVGVGRELVATTIVRPRGASERLDGFHWIADEVLAWLADGGYLPRIDTFVTEWPQIYPGESRRNPNDLFPLCGVVGEVSGRLSSRVKRVSYLPREWGALGDATEGRVREHLTPAERVLLDSVMPAGLRHNAADAVGMFLKYVGRFGRRRAVHNEAAI